MSKCESCALRSGLSSDCGICPGGLAAEQCIERLQSAICTMSWDLDYVIHSTDSVRPVDNASLRAIKTALSNRPVPKKPDFLPEGEWDMKVRGSHTMGHCIILNGKMISVSHREAHILKGYARMCRNEDEDARRILRGEGIHKEGICPVCGGEYEPWKTWSTGENPGNHNWRCADCGSSGRTVYESEFLGHFDLVDGNGNKIETPEENDHDIYTCPCCGERFEDTDDFSSDGYWNHGSGSYGMNGCGASGHAVFGSKFLFHADIKANRRNSAFK